MNNIQHLLADNTLLSIAKLLRHFKVLVLYKTAGMHLHVK